MEIRRCLVRVTGIAVATILAGLLLPGPFGGVTQLVSAKSSEFVRDSFSESTSLLLTNHVGESGANWTLHPGYDSGLARVNAGSDRVYADGDSQAVYYASGAPASPDYDVTAKFYVASQTGSAGVLGRLDPTRETYYGALYRSASKAWELVRVVDGDWTSLERAPQTLSSGSSYEVTLQLRGSTVKLLVDGSEQLSVKDKTIQMAGRAGLSLFDGSRYGEAVGFQPTDFSARNSGGGATSASSTSKDEESKTDGKSKKKKSKDKKSKVTATPTLSATATPTPRATATPPPSAAGGPTPSPTPVASGGVSGSSTPSWYATFLGGSDDDYARDIVVDKNGYVYLTGGTSSTNFPTTAGAYDRSLASGGSSAGTAGPFDVFVAKYDSRGALVCSTLLGGPNYDRAYSIEVDDQGFIYVGGRAGSGFPTSSGAVQRNFAGDNSPNNLYGQQDGFVAKLSGDCSRLIWATYIGTAGHDFVRDIDIDSQGNVYAGMAEVANPYPLISANAFQRTISGGKDGMVVKLSSDGAQVLYATYIGGSGFDAATPAIRVDAAGQAYYLLETQSSNMPLPTTSRVFQKSLGGSWDLYLAKFSADGSRLLSGTYFGGSGNEFIETHGLSLDGQGNAYITANTTSSNLPTTSGAFQTSYRGTGGPSTGGNSNYPGDGFVAKLSPDLARVLACTYLGGSAGDGLQGSEVDAAGNVYVSGATFSSNFPITAGSAIQSTNRGGGDGWVAKLSPDLTTLLYGSFLGGSGFDELRSLAVDSSGGLYSAGLTPSSNFPVSSDAAQRTNGGSSDAVWVRVR